MVFYKHILKLNIKGNFAMYINKRFRKAKGQSKMDNTDIYIYVNYSIVHIVGMIKDVDTDEF